MTAIKEREPEATIANRVLNHLADAWNAYQDLSVVHKDDEHEFKHAIHSAQNIILARSKTGMI